MKIKNENKSKNFIHIKHSIGKGKNLEMKKIEDNIELEINQKNLIKNILGEDGDCKEYVLINFMKL